MKYGNIHVDTEVPTIVINLHYEGAFACYSTLSLIHNYFILDVY